MDNAVSLSRTAGERRGTSRSCDIAYGKVSKTVVEAEGSDVGAAAGRGAPTAKGLGKRKAEERSQEKRASKLAHSGMSRDETIANFQAITGIENLNECVSILEAHNWNLETAAAASLAQHDPFAHSAGQSMAAGTSLSSGGPTRRGPAAQASQQQESRPPPGNAGAPRRGILGYLARMLGSDDSGRRRESDTHRFVEMFDLEHGAVHPTAHVGTFREAVDVAKRDFKFLLVYLHSPHHQDTPAFLRDTLCTEVTDLDCVVFDR